MKKYEAKIAEIDDYGMLEGLGFNQADDAIKIYTFHRHYQIGNKHSYQNLQECIEDNQKDNHVISLYMYEHSGIAFSLEDFNDRWDSGLLGYICIRKNISRLEANKIAYDMVKEENDIQSGAFVELVINELDICDCCNNIKDREYIDGLVFNSNNKKEKEAVVSFVNSYIRDFDINALDTLIHNRYN